MSARSRLEPWLAAGTFRHWVLLFGLFVTSSVVLAAIMLALRACGSSSDHRVNPFGSSGSLIQ